MLDTQAAAGPSHNNVPQFKKRKLNRTKLTCPDCGGEYFEKYRRRHLSSTVHKNHVKGNAYVNNVNDDNVNNDNVNNDNVNNDSENDHPKYGVIINKTYDDKYQDIIFPNMEDYMDQLKKYRTVTPLSRPASPPPLIPIQKTLPLSNLLDYVRENSREEVLKNNKFKLSQFIKFYKRGILGRIQDALEKHNAIKVKFDLDLVLFKIHPDSDTADIQNFGIHPQTKDILRSDNLDKWFEEEIRGNPG